MKLNNIISSILTKKEPAIAIFSRKNITNYGDPIIGDCLAYMLNENLEKKAINVYIYDIYEHKDDEIEQKKYFKKIIKNSNVVIFPGGGINSIKFNKIIHNLIKECELQKKPFFFNSIGLLRVNPNLKNVALLKKMFSNSAVKQITTRGDFNTLKEYTTEKNKIDELVDPGIFSAETYNVKKLKTSQTIGIGVIRPEIFEENSNNKNRLDILEMYQGIIQELLNNSKKFKLFSNGMKSDYKFGIEILKSMDLDPKKYMAPLPQSSIELVQCIAQFEAIIAARMHANIIATSLNIPTIGLVWNDKMNLFAKMVNRTKFYINENQLTNYKKIYSLLVESINTPYDLDLITKIKRKANENMKYIINFTSNLKK